MRDGIFGIKSAYLFMIVTVFPRDPSGMLVHLRRDQSDAQPVADRLQQKARNYLSEKRGSHYYYFVGSRLFDLAELKLLVAIFRLPGSVGISARGKRRRQ